jgi:hypothetical protein
MEMKNDLQIIGCACSLRMRPGINWIEFSNLWGMIIGRPPQSREVIESYEYTAFFPKFVIAIILSKCIRNMRGQSNMI